VILVRVLFAPGFAFDLLAQPLSCVQESVTHQVLGWDVIVIVGLVTIGLHYCAVSLRTTTGEQV
jgi:hypothetical protein